MARAVDLRNNNASGTGPALFGVVSYVALKTGCTLDQAMDAVELHVELFSHVTVQSLIDLAERTVQYLGEPHNGE